MYNIDKIDEAISKSLDSIDKLAKKSEDITKSIMPEDNPDITPGEVAENTTGGNPEVEGAPEVGQEEPTNEVDTDEEQPMAKSLVDTLQENEDVKKALEVSEFLNSLSKGISEVLGNHGESLSKSLQSSNNTNMLLAKSLEGIVNSQQAVMDTQINILKSVQKLTSRLETVESAPRVRKSVSSTQLVVEKDFKKSLGQVDAPETLSKSEVISKLEGEFAKGKISLGNDILRFESTGDLDSLSPDARGILGL